ncbi:MAG TPA: dihydropteroate synthase [Phycisphaerae bacterium]|nr:dihydropteroate synthase [Phycisphaerae bacterium]
MSAKLNLTRPVIMGVLNVTPDSFSDGGRFISSRTENTDVDYSATIQHARELAADGAAIVDVGGEATSFHRPGIVPVEPSVQIQRVVPVIAGVRRQGVMDNNSYRPVTISVDTRSAKVARAALDAGADIINDVSAGTHDQEMFPLTAAHSCPIVLMHSRMEQPGQPPGVYQDVCAEVFGYLRHRAGAAEAAGIARENIFLDPGIGFGKTAADNWKLLSGITQLVRTGYSVLVGVSRKRFLTDLCGEAHESQQSDWSTRDQATAIVTALLASQGVLIHRVHNVKLAVQALTAAELLKT